MQLIAPDILAEAQGLSIALSGAGCAVGFFLWLTGWSWHRFWIVLVTTVTTGTAGLMLAPVYGMRPLVASLLVAIAGGVLALALVRVVVFAAGGVATYVAVHALAPPAWHEPLGWFLVGGLAGLLLFRLWTMALTSMSGALLLAYSLLLLLDRLGRLDAILVAEQRTALLNGACLATTVIGMIVQFLLERRRLRNERLEEERIRQMTEREQQLLQSRRGGWFSWGQSYRRAG